jgi:glycosyltransferase involved in cell wall biosynthesis
LAGFALGALRVPWVLDVDDWEGRGGWADVNPDTPAQKWSITLMEALLPRLARGVTAASRTLEARAWDMGLARSRVTYLPNGVWRDKYGAWAANPLDRDKLRETLGLVGRPTVLLYTRFDVFPIEWPLTILKQIVEEQPDAALLVVGEGLRGEERVFLDHAEHMGLRDNLVMAGYVQGDTLPAYLSLGDVGIYPMQDTLLNRAKSPMKVLEPMLMGIPLVAHRVGQASEFVGDAGVLIQPGDLPGMASAVLSLLRDPARRARLGQQAQARVWDCYNWERLSRLAEAAYERALGKLV